MKDLTALITRPQPQADELANLIRQQGGRALVYPSFTVQEPLDKNALMQAIDKLSSVDWAIFVSLSAVHSLTLPSFASERRVAQTEKWFSAPLSLRCCEGREVGGEHVIPLSHLWERGRGEGANVLNDLPHFAAVGKSTQAALKKIGITAISPEKDFSSEALLALPQFQNVAHQKIMIFQGETGRGLLQQVLQDRGAQVETVIAYRRVKSEPVDIAVLQEWQRLNINVMIHTSAEGMLNFFECVDVQYHPWLKSIPSLVISNRLAEIARSINIETIIESRGASNSEILKCLMNYNKGKK